MQYRWIVALCLLVLAGTAMAQEDTRPAETKWYDKLDFGGSLRFRYEGFNWAGHYDDGRRDRFRYRLRFGFTMQAMKDVKLGFELVSGNPQNPISDNQSMDTGLDKKRIAISQVYADWQVTEPFNLIVGKIRPKGLLTVSDIEWDDDVTVEGAMQLVAWDLGPTVKELHLNLYQLVLNESGSGVDSYLLGGQIAPVFGFGPQNQVTVGMTYETITNPSVVAKLYFDGDLALDSEYVTNLYDPNSGELVSDFHVESFFAEWKNKRFKRVPIKLTGYYYKNLGAKDAIGAILPVNGDPEPLAEVNASQNATGYFARLQLGDYKKPGQVAIRGTRYYAKPDAMFFAYTQSDSRRSSNVDGYRADLRIGMPNKGYINLTWYHTDWLVGEGDTMDRWQVDYIIKF